MNENYEAIMERQRHALSLSLIRAAMILPVKVFAFYYCGMFDKGRLVEGIPSIMSLLRESLPPSFADFRGWLKPLFETLLMSVAGTVLAIVLSLPLAFLAARNTTPHQLVYQGARGVLNSLRAIPELIMGIIFVAAVGFGALPGVLALGLHSVGMVGKFFSEAIEHVDEEPVEAVTCAGATRLQTIVHGVLPQVMPQIADVSIYRWEYNFRASTVMGMVGAGGIGLELMSSLRLMQYQEVSAILILILVTVTLVDGFGATLRKRFK